MIRISDDIAVRVVGIEGNRVRLAVEAPRVISVQREEVYRRIVQEREVAGAAV